MTATPVTPLGPTASESVEFHLTGHDGTRVLICAGELDIVSGPALDRALRALEATPGRLGVDLCAVGFADTHGLAPLFESARRRRADGREPIEISSTSRQVGRVLQLLQVPPAGPVDVHAWDAAAVRAWPAAN
jgi:anti-anti-sigma regulatory factor